MYDNAEPPPQRRDNGLRADTFVALADVDPRLGEHLLDLLRLADIAAYLEPPGDPRIATRHRVAGPIERLFVQSDLRRAAREVVLAAAREAGADTGANTGATSADALAVDRQPGELNRSSSTSPSTPDIPGTSDQNRPPERDRPDLLSGLDTDVEFARIMAGYDVVAPPRRRSEPGPSGPAGDDAPEDTRSSPHGVTGEQLDTNADELARAADMAASSAAARDEAADEEQEHFVPPPAPPFPIPRGETVGAIMLLLFGLLVIARGDWLGLGSDASFPIGVVLVLTAIVLLIRGLHDSEPEDTDPDDGAVV